MIFNQVLAIGAVLILILAIGSSLGGYFLPLQGFKKFVFKKRVLITGLLALGGVIGSLTYSIVLGYEPCYLCWWQRIFMYSFAVLAFVSILFKKPLETIFLKSLAFLGLGFSLYHNIIDIGSVAGLDCGASSVSCTIRYVYEFGFMTIPMMALMLFVSMLLVLNLKSRP